MFEDNEQSATMEQLFDYDDNQESNEVETEELEAEESENEEADELENTEESEESEESEETEEPAEESPKVLATVEIDGKEFELDEQKIQTITEKYVEVAQENRALKERQGNIDKVVGYIENIQNGKDIDESMQALGVDFDALIRDRVKDFIRRSTLSEKERQLEDTIKEREKLAAKLKEREEREAAELETRQGQEQANLIIDNVNLSISKIPEQYRKEIQIEVFGAIERRLRQGGNRPSAKAINNAVQTIYKRKYANTAQKSNKVNTSKKVQPPKLVKNNPSPSTTAKKSAYNATDYSELF